MSILERLADLMIAKRRWVVAIAVVITAAMAYGATKVRLNADFSTYLNQNDPLVRAYNYIGDTFGGNSIGIVLITAPDVFQPEVVRAIDRLTEAYQDVDGIAYVTSLTNVVDFRNVEGGIEVGRLVGRSELPRTSGDAEALRDRVMKTDRLVGNLVSEDGTAAAIMLRFGGDDGAGRDRFSTAIRVREATDEAAAVEALPQGAELYYGGMPFLVYNMTLLISKNMTVLAPLMVFVLLLVLFLGIRGWGGVVYPLTVVLASTVWTVGLMGYLGLRMDLLSGIMPVILIALGSADGVHFMKRFYERRHQGDSGADAVRATYRETGVPLVVTTLTTMVGFSALAISQFAVIRQFGLLTALGLFLALLVTLTLLPALASQAAGRTRRGAFGTHGGAMARFARVVHHRPRTVLMGTGALAALAMAGVPRIAKDVDWTLCLARGSGPFHAEMLIREKFGGSLPIQIMVDGDLKDPAILQQMRAVERRLDALSLAGNSQSIAGVISEMNDVMNDRFATPEERAGIANLWFLIEDEEMLDQMVARDNQQGLIQARLVNWHTATVAAAVDTVAAFLDGLPPRLGIVDPDALTDSQRRELTALRRLEFARKLQWDLEGRGVEVDPDRLEPVVASLFGWQPGEAAHEAVRRAVRSYVTSSESELSLSSDEGRRLADRVAQAWADGQGIPSNAIQVAVASTLPTVDPWDAEALAWSLHMVSRNAVGTARVDAAITRIERLTPAVRTDPVLRRNLRGTLWEASASAWTVDAAVAERVGISGGPAVSRTVQAGFSRSGMASVLKQMEEELTPTQIESVMITLIVVVLLLSIIFRSAAGGVLALAPLVVTIVVNFGVMGFLGIGLDSFTAMVASIAIGLGIDYAIHFTHRFRRELAVAAGDVEAALARTLSTSGVAVLVNAGSVGLGFLVLLAAGGQHIRRFGGLSSLTMFVAAGLTLTLLPALYVILRPRFLIRAEATASHQTTKEVAMRTRIKRAGTALALMMAIVPTAAAGAQNPDGRAVLAKVDSVLSAPRDQSGVERMVLVDTDGTTKERALQFYQKGGDWRLVRFSKPADVRGVGFLRLAEDRMYLYLPAFRRVRRIASSIKNDGFMGTDFSYEDLAQTRYSPDYQVTAATRGADAYTLTLEPRDGADVSYGRLVMEVGAADWVARKIEYFDPDGEPIKTFTAAEIREIDGYAYVTRMEMVTLRSGHRTVLELEEVQLDSGLPDDLFTQRSLKRAGAP